MKSKTIQMYHSVEWHGKMSVNESVLKVVKAWNWYILQGAHEN